MKFLENLIACYLDENLCYTTIGSKLAYIFSLTWAKFDHAIDCLYEGKINYIWIGERKIEKERA